MVPPATFSAPERLRLADVLGALSYALDLTEGQPPGHSLRSCWIGMHVGMRLGLSPVELQDLHYTLLLKDAGCSSNAARVCELYGGDDRTIKRDVKLVDLQSMRQLARFVLGHTGLGSGLKTRFKLILNLMRRGQAIADELVSARCTRGADIARLLGFSARVADGVRGLDEHWNGKGRPLGLAGTAIPLGSRIALLAQVIDVFQIAGGAPAARREIRQRAGVWFDPAVVRAAEAELDAGVLDAFTAPEFDRRVADLEPSAVTVSLDDARMDAIAAGFGEIVDAKSPFTFGHSGRVAAYCVAMAAELGFDAERQRWVRRAGLLHDIGKLGVSNAILDKPGKLDGDEWDAVRKHAGYTHAILARIAPFERFARVAAAHHERLDGTGYPWGLRHDEIELETRIITTADIFDAISADRPYRAGMPFTKVVEVMNGLRGSALDPVCVDALFARLPQVGGQDAEVLSLPSLLGRPDAMRAQRDAPVA